MNESIYEDELIKNTTIEICYEATNTNSNSIYIPINICLNKYNGYELYAYIDGDCSIYFGKKFLKNSLLLEFMWNNKKFSESKDNLWKHNEAQ